MLPKRSARCTDEIPQISTLKKANNGKFNNANPRGNDTLASYKKTVPSDVLGCFERAKAAHSNMMENAPFFVGAVLAGNMARLSAGVFSTVHSDATCICANACN